MRRTLGGLVALAVLAALPVTAAALSPTKAEADKFAPAQACGCHAALNEQWSGSMHAQALTDPLYRVKLEEADKATDGALAPFCNRCHGPAATMMGQLDNGTSLAGLSGAGAESIGCDTCHQVTRVAKPLGNTSLVLMLDGVKRAQWADSISPGHGTAFSEIHTKAEFCGACHNVDHPINGMHLEATYSEWKAGPYAAEGIVCQDCHMTPGPGVTKPNPGEAAAMGPDREHIYTMTWAGGNVALGPEGLAEERLKAAARLKLALPQGAAPSKPASVVVTVENVGAGHMLPTGLTEVRQMWLELTAVDSGGKSVVSERHDFGTVLADEKGKHPVELWEASTIYSDDRIPPKGSKDVAFDVKMPADAKITATLYYRSVPEELAKKAKVDVPTTEMASVSEVVGDYTEPEAAGATDASGGGLPWWAYAAAASLAAVGGYLIWAARAKGKAPADR